MDSLYLWEASKTIFSCVKCTWNEPPCQSNPIHVYIVVLNVLISLTCPVDKSLQILTQVMWAMEYNPNMFQCYEKSQEPSVGTKINSKLLKQYGKFERKNVETGSVDRNSALAVFLVASFLETKNKKLLKEAKGLDDVVQVSSLS